MPNALARMTYIEVIKLAMRRAQRPTSVKELLEVLARGGRPISTADPCRSLYKVLLFGQ